VLKNLCSVVVGVLLISSPLYGQAQESSLEAAKKMLESGHPEQSLVLVEPIIADAMLKEAKDPDAICPSAAAAVLQSFMKGDFSVSVENDWCDAMLVKGYALNELKRPAEAAQVLKALVGHAPSNANYLSEYAYTVRVTGELERSLDLYKRAESITSKLPNRENAAHWLAVALRGQGYAFSELRRWDEAKKAYERSLRYDPKNEIALHELQYIAENRSR
jgi:tetratricopeptide (TPR) repeat protein